MPFFVADLSGWVHPADVFIALHSSDENAFWLDRESHPTERFSVIGASTHRVTGESFSSELIESYLVVGEEVELDLPFEFRPGLVGYISYEGSANFLHVDRAMVFDHDQKIIYFIGNFDSQKDFDSWHHAALLRLALCGGEQAAYRMQNRLLEASSAKARHSNEKYLELIRKAQQHIAAGDVYQLCLTNQLTIEVEGDPLLTYLKLRSVNPAPYAAYLKIDQTHLLCSSPEQFLRVTAAGELSSKPIKGTRRRDAIAEVDRQLAEELRTSEKERAENLMIVDLMRNDLGRVAQPDSVTVDKLFEIESYATVHQLVSTVEAQLQRGFTVVDAILAAFPGGSMTGAPKLKAMQIIEDLERPASGDSGRGVYSGVIGYIAGNGAAEFGMTIRTLVVEGKQATLGVGGGITIDSEPEFELEETKLKAAALLKLLDADDPWSAD